MWVWPRMSRRRSTIAIVALLGGIVWSVPARAQCGGTRLCAPGTGDCTVAASCTITVPAGGLVIDLGARRLVITKTLTVAGPAGAGLTITAGNVLIDGGTIVAPGSDGMAGGITILSASDVTVRNRALVDVKARSAAGAIHLEALGGSVTFGGAINASGTSLTGNGGYVLLSALDSVTVDATVLDVSGGDQAFGGSIRLQAQTGSTVVRARLDAAGGDGGEISISAGSTLQVASDGMMIVSARGDAGSGGIIDIDAEGDITIATDSTGRGAAPVSSEDAQNGGDGADVSVSSFGGNVSLSGSIDVGAAPGGFGGEVDLDAARDLTIASRVLTTGWTANGSGGDVFLVAGGALSISQPVNAGGNDSGSGGTIDALATGNVTVSALLSVSGGQTGGTIVLAGCTVNITSTGALSAQGPGVSPLGSNIVRAGSTMTIAGALRASSQNLLQYRAPPPPAIGSRAVVEPAATLRLDPTLPCCVGCPSTTTTTTSIVGTTSTTTTLPGGSCGDRVVTGAEQCDDGNLVAGDCCSPTCRFESAGSSCASDGDACSLDVCNATGTCTHPAGNAGAVCRAAAGPCDRVETCSGTAPACPADIKSTAVCRPGASACDAPESCPGTSNSCPIDLPAPAGTICRAAAGECDAPETCAGAGGACPADGKRTGVCRPAAGTCDVAESCDGIGNACPADATAPDGAPCGGGGCGSGGLCASGTCTGATPGVCGPCEACNAATGACVPAPRPTCVQPMSSGKARLLVRKSLRGPGKDMVIWKWLPGPATATSDFGDPLTSDGLALCIYDRSQAAPKLLFRSEVAAGGSCGGRPCWSANGRMGFKFASDGGNATGVTNLLLLAGADGRARIKFQGRGVNLSDRPFEIPHPPLVVPLTAQLQSEHGQCWEARFSRPGLSRNDNQEFRARAD